MVETVYVTTHLTLDENEDPVIVLATIDFDAALDSIREFPMVAENSEGYRFIDVWRSGHHKYTLFFGENGLETAEVAVQGEVAPAVQV